MTTFERAVRQGSTSAAIAAALAPLFGNDPTVVGAMSFAVGFVVYRVGAGLAAYVLGRGR